MNYTDLIREYTLKLSEAAACRPGKPPLVAEALFTEDIHEVFPYLYSRLHVRGFVREPAAMIVVQGKGVKSPFGF